jgi:hypothetical protein
MEKITFNHYKNAIQQHYEINKNDDITGILLNPTPAQLRNYCSLIFDKGLTPKDEEVFRNFFETKNCETLKKAIDNCNTDKFKTIISFLKEKRDSEISLRVELAAVLIDFKPRPYNKFNKTEVTKNEILNFPEKNDLIVNKSALPENKTNFIKNHIKSNFKKKIAIGLFGLIGIGSVGYAGKSIIFSEPECMQWQKNHFEVVDCQSDNQKGFMMQSEIIPFDENQSQLIKIEVSDTTTFFKNEKPLYWYCKVNGKPEFFNTHGIHPETGKALKPVSQYIVNKYVK